MQTKEKAVKEKPVPAKNGGAKKEKPKSPMVLFWEKYPNGYLGGIEIKNMRAVLK